MDGAPPPMPDGKRQEKVPGFVWLLVALGILVLAGVGGLWAIFSRMAAEPAISAKAFVERLSDGKDPKWLVVSRDENNRPLLLDLKRGNEKFAVDLSAIDNNRVKVTGDNYIFYRRPLDCARLGAGLRGGKIENVAAGHGEGAFG